MEEQMIKLKVNDMFCSNCEGIIEKVVKTVDGVSSVRVSYKKGTVLVMGNAVRLEQVKNAITDAGYTPTEFLDNDKKGAIKKYTTITIATISIAFIYYILRELGVFDLFPQVDNKMDYITLFVVGLITSIHCISMCGGVNLSLCMGIKNQETGKAAALIPSILYNAGRVVSYTIVGGIVGGLGSVISFGGQARGIVALLAGVFMIVMGINMTGIFPALRRFTIKMPKLINKSNSKRSNAPFVVGLLNGLMPCGPLQAMQLYALGTGSIFAGALSMFFFSVGTVPLMFALGALGSILKKKHADIVLKIGAILVIVLGISMIATGLALSGIAI